MEIASNLKPLKILEVAMEIALPKSTLDQIAEKFGPERAQHAAMSTSVGGIGPLLRERIMEQGDQGLEMVGVSLLYESVWIQKWQEWEQVILEERHIVDVLRKVMTPTNLDFELTLFDGRAVNVKVWELAYGKAKVYFLDVPEVSDTVYPGPKDAPVGTSNPYAWSHVHRLKQSWLIGRGALTLCKKLNWQPDVVVLSETPTLFTHHKLVRDPFQSDEFFSKTKYVFNDHTPLEYAHPVWDPYTLEMVKVDTAIYTKMPAWNSHKMTLDVTSLLVGFCDGVYGVAKKHGEVMRTMPSLRPYSEKIQFVTNGVRVEDWQAPEFKTAEKMADADLLALKDAKRKDLLEWAWRRFRLWPTWAQQARKKKVVLWTRRITPYKRLDILSKVLHHAEMRKRFLTLDLVMFVGGRIHQQDNHAQDIVYDLLDTLAHDAEAVERVIFIDNFNVWEAPLLYQGADGAIMLADDTREASATGFMKAQMNGGAVIATEDGAIPEFVHAVRRQPLKSLMPTEVPDAEASAINGFHVPYVKGEPTMYGFLEALEDFCTTMKDPQKAAAVMRMALKETDKVSVARTARETKALYEQILYGSPEPGLAA
ncbi:MAG: glycogen/starch/alpha-glucan phosphorylase [Elusimicrobia bacterium]|nr:glycogen/starch/alpha-glucan phosphorylase [Candidatus Obscuribacterium magneticum]